MGFILTINDHLDVELRRESVIIHDDELHSAQEAPEFHYRRVYPLIAALKTIEESERFQRWLARAENRPYDQRCGVQGFPQGDERTCELQRGHKGAHQQGTIKWLGYHSKRTVY